MNYWLDASEVQLVMVALYYYGHHREVSRVRRDTALAALRHMQAASAHATERTSYDAATFEVIVDALFYLAGASSADGARATALLVRMGVLGGTT